MSETREAEPPPAPPGEEPPVLRPLGWVAAAVVFLLMALTAADVGGRYMFNAPISGAAYLVAALMGVMIFVALPLVTMRDEHLRAGLLDHMFKGAAKRLKERLTLAVSFLTLCALAYVLWHQGTIYGRTHAQLPSIGVSLASVAYLGAAMSGLSAAIVLVGGWRHLTAQRRSE